MGLDRPDLLGRLADAGGPVGTAGRVTAADVASQMAQASHRLTAAMMTGPAAGSGAGSAPGSGSASGSASGTTEISLNPRELGQVTLSLQMIDGSMVVLIATERPETADLMRRHIDTLAQEFRSLGYQDASFTFTARHGSAEGQARNPDAAPDDRATPMDHPADTAADRYMPRPAAGQTGRGGLDLRL